MTFRIVSTLFTALALVACSDPEGGGSTNSNGLNACDQDPNAEVYSAGMSKTSTGGITVALEDAVPAPPQQGVNAWSLFLTDGGGAAISDATLSVVCRMSHVGSTGSFSHGCGVAPEIQNTGNGGYSVTSLLFNMGGHWDVTVIVDRDGAASEQVTFSFCM